MKKHYKGLVLVLGAIVFVVILVKWHYASTKGFRVAKVLRPINFDEKFARPIMNIPENIQRIIDQEFTYIGKGRQVYVFESEDQKYVIKLMRLHKYHLPLWAKTFSFLHLLTPWHTQILLEKEIRLERAMQSYQIAFDQLATQTQLLYMHLDPNSVLKKSVKLKDHMGSRFIVDLDQVSFCIQKKATSLATFLRHLHQQKEEKKIKEMISLLLDAVNTRLTQNILNRDFSNLLINYGFDGKNIVEMDVGSFYRGKIASSMDWKNELFHFTKTLQQFIKKEMPHLLSFYEKKVENITKREQLR